LTQDLAADHGAIIYSPSNQSGLAILAGSPASRAGLALNDIITYVDGRRVDLDDTLSDILYDKKKGDKLELTVIRNRREIKVSLDL
jgi:serine protease Do